MGYSFYLISKEKEITATDFNTAVKRLSEFNRTGLMGGLVCDLDHSPNHIRVSGSFGMSGTHCEGFVLNLLINLTAMGFNIGVVSDDFGYGSKEDKKWINKHYNDKSVSTQVSGTSTPSKK